MGKQGDGLRIVRLNAENVKRLKAVEVKPGDGALVPIKGPNAAGKTSVLDCIEMGIGANIPKRPLRNGTDSGHIILELADDDGLKLIVERRFTEKGSYLYVREPDGDQKSSPQKLLDSFCSKFTFDPLEFTRMKAADQRDLLLRLTGHAERLEELDGQLAGAMEQRKDVKKELAALQGQLAGYDDLPAERPAIQSMADIQARRDKLREECNAYDERKREADAQHDASQARLEDGIECKKEIERLRAAIEVLEAKAQALKKETQAHADAAQAGYAVLAQMKRPDDEEFAALDAEAVGIQESAAIAARFTARDETNAAADKKEQAVADCEAAVAAIRNDIAELLKAASFPLDGLAYASDGVEYNGIPFAQCSSAEQLRISLAMGMAMNPDLRVMRITDGSLLDDNSLAMIREAAAGSGYQVWVEMVETKRLRVDPETGEVALGEDGEPLYDYPDVGVYIEDGAVVAVDSEPVEKRETLMLEAD